MPGTTCAAQNATCSVSAKKLSGLRLSTILPTGVSGTSSSGTILVASSTSKLKLSACFSENSWKLSSHSGKGARLDRLPQIAAVKVRIGAADLHRLVPVERVGPGDRVSSGTSRRSTCPASFTRRKVCTPKPCIMR